MTVAQPQQTVVKVVLVGRRYPQARCSGPTYHGEDQVEQRHPEDHQRDEHRSEEEEGLSAKRRLGPTTHRHRRSGHEQAQQQCPTVAHEDPRWMHVVGQEPHTDPYHDDGQDRPRVALEQEALVA